MRLDLLEERYVLGRLLGTGGMGQVWEAQDETLGRRVAVKVLAAPAADATAAERFIREARAAARLSHPGIVAVFDVGQESDGRLFMVMELVEGRSLDELLREHGPLPAERVAGIGARTAHALAAAHAAGVIHRDVKPANLLLAADSGTVKVADFGIAVLADDTATALTSTSALIGTVPYIAPERALGRPATPASDLYALGCVLYEALAGHPPFRADNVARTLFQHCYQPPEPITDVNPETDPQLAEVVHALLAKDPADRPADAEHTAALLARCASQRTSPTEPLAVTGALSDTRPPPGTRPLGPPPKAFVQRLRHVYLRWRERGRWSLAAVGALTLAASAGGLAVIMDGTASSRSDTTHSSATASASAAASAQATPTTTATGLSELVDEITDRLEGPAAPTEPGLAAEVRHRLSDISDRIDADGLDEAADMVRGLRARLATSRTQGIWDGDARTEQLLSRLAAQLPTVSSPDASSAESGQGQGPGHAQGPGGQ
ncbi:serine/threonine-protein kinase [Streptomyces sp. NPDC058464]|uniref:serine/threonine-protein kinase n=1 Tax=Streptomyces sp. NPDC058464 TaxID=3346511 RepID=UPI00365B3743